MEASEFHILSRIVDELGEPIKKLQTMAHQVQARYMGSLPGPRLLLGVCVVEVTSASGSFSSYSIYFNFIQFKNLIQFRLGSARLGSARLGATRCGGIVGAEENLGTAAYRTLLQQGARIDCGELGATAAGEAHAR